MDMTLSSKDSLMHYGVPGMKWGKRKAAAGATPKDQLRRMDKENRALNKSNAASANAKRDRQIDAARARRDSGESWRELKTAKKAYKADKITVGKVAAKQTLQKARDKYAKDIETAAQIKSGKESTTKALLTLGSIGVASALALQNT